MDSLGFDRQRFFLRHQPTFAGLVVALTIACTELPVCAQFPDGQESQTLRAPYIPGTIVNQPYETPNEGAPPPIGSGMDPLPVTPGHLGLPQKPPSCVDLPATNPTEKDKVNELSAPYLKPPASVPGNDPGAIAGPNGFYPPAAVVNINGQGGIHGNAPIERWGGQVTKDLGYPRNTGSQTVDFGQDIDQLASVEQRGIRRSVSFDGPRRAIYPGTLGSPTNRQANLPGANYTTDLNGNRQLFKGANIRSAMTVVSY